MWRHLTIILSSNYRQGIVGRALSLGCRALKDRKIVLVVDDDPNMTSIFSLGLQDEGFEVYTYNDPLDALSKFRPKFYDLLLVDINMPNRF